MGIRRPVLLALAAVIAMGVYVRTPGLNDPPVKFHPTRQYHGLQGARATYLRWTPGASETERRIATVVERRELQLEPPILETVTAGGYKVLGGEHIWVGRMLSLLAWVGGSVALFALARRLLDSDAAGVVAAAIMLLLPYTVESSRSFQPDPLLVALTVTATWLLVRYDDGPSPQRFLVAVAVSGAAVLVKAVAAPYLVLVFLALVVARFGWRRGLTQPALWGFSVLAVVPAGLYYLISYVTGGEIKAQAEGSFIPSMFRHAHFWHAWANQITTVTTRWLAVVAFVVSLALARERRVRLVMGALWLAYFLVGLAVAYRTATHDYYHLPLVPVVALGAAVGVARVGWGRALVAASLVVILAVAVSTEPTPLPARQKAALLRETAHIGSAVHHSTHVLYIAPAYGQPLEYHGRLAGVWWPTRDDLALERLQGEHPMSAPARLRTLSRKVDGADWFVLEDLRQLKLQPDLQRLLAGFKVADAGETYRIYDLRTRV